MSVPPPGDGPPPGYGPPPTYGPPSGYGPPLGYGPPPGWVPPPGYGPPPGWVPVRPTSTLAVAALVCIAVFPPVGVLLAWLALGETHPVVGSRGGRELATVALWVNVGLTAVVLLVLGAVMVQLLGTLAVVLPAVATSGV